MRRTTRWGSALLLATAVGPVLSVAPASAAPSSESASSSGYFSATGPQDTGTPAGTPANVGTMVDGVAAGNLAVQGGGGQEQKVSFLLFPGEGLEPGARVSSAVLTVPLAEGEGNVQASPAPEKVRVCAVDDTGFGGEDGAALEAAPARLCDVFSAPGKASADGGSYVFDVTALAQRWTEANDGLALTAAEGATTAPFQVVFAAGDQARLSYTATAPAADAAPAPAASAGAGTGAGATSAAGDSGTAEAPALGPSGGFPAPAGELAVDGGPDLVEAPVTAPLDASPVDPGLAVVPGSVPVAEAAPAPQTTIEAVAVAQPTVTREPTLTPGAPFWTGLASVAGLLALVSLVLGDGEVPRPGRPTSRLAQALQARQQSGAAGRPTPSLTLHRA